MREIDKIIVHCSASDFGDAQLIDQWHRERGFKMIGYHYVILNGYRRKGVYREDDDGLIEIGRPLDEVGAHCRGYNKTSIGICLIGNRLFSERQLFYALPSLLKELMNRFSLGLEDVYGHREFNLHKSCPNFDIQAVLKKVLGGGSQVCRQDLLPE